MAVNPVSAVIDRLQADQSFRVEYCEDPDNALASYHLDSEDLHALKTGDGLRLELMGLGEKWSEFVAALCGPNPGD
jgi:invasion protein IalB